MLAWNSPTSRLQWVTVHECMLGRSSGSRFCGSATRLIIRGEESLPTGSVEDDRWPLNQAGWFTPSMTRSAGSSAPATRTSVVNESVTCSGDGGDIGPGPVSFLFECSGREFPSESSDGIPLIYETPLCSLARLKGQPAGSPGPELIRRMVMTRPVRMG
jgi:hypothetical protein